MCNQISVLYFENVINLNIIINEYEKIIMISNCCCFTNPNEIYRYFS